jgi:DNA repair exonuclease SbcCD ATPase subunit
VEVKQLALYEEIEFFEKHCVCPTCHQDIEETFRANTIESKRRVVVEIENNNYRLDRRYDSLKQKLNEARERREAVTDLKVKAQLVRTRLDSLKKQGIELKEEIRKKVDVHFVGAIAEVQNLETVLDGCVKTIHGLQVKSDINDAVAYLLKDTGIKAKIIRQYIPVMNTLINKYLAHFELFAEFEIDEHFNETIRSRHRDAFSYESFSEGEKARLDLAILFAWRDVAKLRNSMSTNLLIMDEVFDGSLDADGSEFLLKLIRNLAENSSIVVISHKIDALSDRFSRIVRFEKYKNFSKVVGVDS